MIFTPGHDLVVARKRAVCKRAPSRCEERARLSLHHLLLRHLFPLPSSPFPRIGLRAKHQLRTPSTEASTKFGKLLLGELNLLLQRLEVFEGNLWPAVECELLEPT